MWILVTDTQNPELLEYRNHLNTEHPKYEHSTFQTLFCLGFKQSDHMIRPTIQIPDILSHKTDIFFRFSDHHSTTGHVWTIKIPDLSGIQMVTVPNYSSATFPMTCWAVQIRILGVRYQMVTELCNAFGCFGCTISSVYYDKGNNNAECSFKLLHF